MAVYAANYLRESGQSSQTHPSSRLDKAPCSKWIGQVMGCIDPCTQSRLFGRTLSISAVVDLTLQV